jgi:NhaP-type Na+/H+ or K+/H+ antiporter
MERDTMSEKRSTGVNPTALGLALGLLWGGGMAVLGLVSRIGWGRKLREVFEDLYVGYDKTNVGIAIGALWGFLDAFVAGFLLGWLYNRLEQHV